MSCNRSRRRSWDAKSEASDTSSSHSSSRRGRRHRPREPVTRGSIIINFGTPSEDGSTDSTERSDSRASGGSRNSQGSRGGREDRPLLRSGLTAGETKVYQNDPYDPVVEKRREKQIEFGKNTLAYDRYVAAVPREKRAPDMPQTPPKRGLYSRRAFDGLVKQWKIRLHQWDAAHDNDCPQGASSPRKRPAGEADEASGSDEEPGNGGARLDWSEEVEKEKRRHAAGAKRRKQSSAAAADDISQPIDDGGDSSGCWADILKRNIGTAAPGDFSVVDSI